MGVHLSKFKKNLGVKISESGCTFGSKYKICIIIGVYLLYYFESHLIYK